MREAGKCLALGNNTACVFHCMRIMEAALVPLGKALSVDPATNWNNALNQIEKEIRSRSAFRRSTKTRKTRDYAASCPFPVIPSGCRRSA
jgi:hypothetical protein